MDCPPKYYAKNKSVKKSQQKRQPNLLPSFLTVKIIWLINVGGYASFRQAPRVSPFFQPVLPDLLPN